MESKEIIEFYQQHKAILDKLSETQENSDLSRFLVYIVDTPQKENFPFLLQAPSDLAFDNTEGLKKIFSRLFKSPPAETPDGQKINSIFQIHLIIFQPLANVSFIASSEMVKATGFFNKISGKTNIELWMFWGNLIQGNLNAITEEDQRLRKLIIRNYFREAQDIFYQKTEYKKVEDLLAYCLNLAPDDSESLVLMGRCKLFLSEFEAAEDIFGKVTVLSPKNERAWLGLATAQMEIFKMNPRKEHIAYVDAAERNVDTGRKLNPQNSDLLNLKSGICMIRKDNIAAEKYLLEALALKPDEINTIKNLGLAYLSGFKFNEALAQFEKAFNMKPTDESTVYRIIQCLFELKADERAKNMLAVWKAKARNQNWVNELESTYLIEIPEEFQDKHLSNPPPN